MLPDACPKKGPGHSQAPLQEYSCHAIKLWSTMTTLVFDQKCFMFKTVWFLI